MQEVKNNFNIFQRIGKVMEDVEYIQKKDQAAKGLPYKFVSHDQVVGALHKAFVNYGIVFTTTIASLKQDGNRTTVEVEVAFINIDDPQDKHVATFYGQGIDQQDKGIGKAVSYATKYALLKTFMLETGDDPERDNVDYVPGAITAEQALEIEQLINGNDALRADALKWAQAPNVESITSDKFAKLLHILQVKAKKGGAS